MTGPRRWLPPLPMAAALLVVAVAIGAGLVEARGTLFSISGLGVVALLAAVGEGVERRAATWRAKLTPPPARDTRPAWLASLEDRFERWRLIAPGRRAEFLDAMERADLSSFGPGWRMALGSALSILRADEVEESEAPNGTKPTARLLVDVRSDGQRGWILRSCGAAAPDCWHGVGEHVALEELNLDVPAAPGLWVWEGRITQPTDLDEEPMWIGSWRRPTVEEAQSYAAGLPVWEDRHG